MALKLNIGTKEGKTFQKDISDDDSKALMGKKIGDKVSGNSIGFSGYEFEITGGSDNAGFPMRRDVSGTARKKILTTKGVGFRAKKKGLRERRTVAGNTISKNTVQVNMRILKEGSKPLGAEEAKPAEESGGEEAKPEQKEEPKQEEKKEASEEKKEEPEKKEDAPEEPEEEADEASEEKKESSDEAEDSSKD